MAKKKKSTGSNSSSKSNATTSTTKKNYVLRADETGLNADIANKAQAYLTGGTYTPGQAMDTNWWGSGGGKSQMYGNDKTYKGMAMTATDMARAYELAKKYDAMQTDNAYNSGYSKAQGDVSSMVESAMTPYQQMFSNMQSQQNDALLKAQKASTDQINNNYDLSARNFYQLYKTQQAKLPENLSKAGVTGGASESAQLKLLNNYSENLYKNEAARNGQLAGVDQNYNDKIAENSINAASKMANAYLQLAQQQMSYKREDEVAAAERQYEAEQRALEQEIAKWNRNVQSRMRQQLEKGDTIWTWTDDDGRMHWTTYEAQGLAMGGKKLSPSKSKAKTQSSGSGGGGGSGTSQSVVDISKMYEPASQPVQQAGIAPSIYVSMLEDLVKNKGFSEELAKIMLAQQGYKVGGDKYIYK